MDELAYGAPLVVAAEVFVQVEFALLVRPGTRREDIRSVATHPHGEAQVRSWLRANLPDARVDLTNSTAAAAAAVAEGTYDGAISAPIAGQVYGLETFAAGIGDTEGAITRFVLLTRPAPPPPSTGADRTSLVAFIRANHTGALLEVLTEFAIRGINLTRIESRPTKALMGQYCFFIDAEGHIADTRVGEALAALHRICSDLRYLGSYPRTDDGDGTSAPQGRRDADFDAAAEWLAQLRQNGST